MQERKYILCRSGGNNFHEDIAYETRERALSEFLVLLAYYVSKDYVVDIMVMEHENKLPYAFVSSIEGNNFRIQVNVGV